MLRIFDSPAQLAALYEKTRPPSRQADDPFGAMLSWYSNETATESLRFARSGNTALVPEAERYLDSLDHKIETPRLVWDRSPAGAFAVVPDVLAGLPTPMRRRVYAQSEVAPVTVIVTTSSSAGVSAKLLEKRGTIILSLVMALTRIRPVTLYQIDIGDGLDGDTVFLTRINTTPLDLATACYVLTSQGYTRRLCYNLGKWLNGFSGNWPTEYRANASRYYNTLIKDRLGLKPEDTLLIREAHLSDRMLAQPLAWVQEQLNHFAKCSEADALAD